MKHELDPKFSFETNVLEAGAYFSHPASDPEALPIHMSTAHNVEDVADLLQRYKEGDYCYNRNRNPNRNALAELVAYTEGGEAAISCSAGMAAISTAIIALTKAGDHIISDKTIYGESNEVFTDILGKYGVETSVIDCTNLDEVKAHLKPNTAVIYTETVGNPLCNVADLKALSELAHSVGALLVVDNTFMTGALARPLELGADLEVISLTKFANGHSDAVTGAIVGPADLVKKCHNIQVVLGTQADPFSSWLTCRGMRTMKLRIEQQDKNAQALAAALEKSPYVKNVFHASLESSPYHELAKAQFNGHYGGMMTIELPEEEDYDAPTSKFNKFMRTCKLAHYAMTLGGYRTTFSYPPHSSHDNLTREQRYAIGITDSMLRFSIGIENTEELVADILNALEVAYGNN
ncbi:MAG: PLP-dependent aspartate aminotransferase family protein [Clostridia bacterium]|nr:PLP-dependent aspartate aminotransferase family protein [Clostridia bacterium]